VRIAADFGGGQRLQAMVGHKLRSPAAALAVSLECRRADVAKVLRRRGDGDLADLV
jgi:hypothetical protein